MRTCVALLFCFVVSGCTSGGIYSHITRPLVTDLRGTPIGEKTAAQDIKHFTIEGYHIEWDSNAIGEIAKNHGIEEIYYADLETLSILGIWSQYHVHIYGR